MELNLLKEIITGSITGYITNAIAVKMIFREYGIGKFKVGGIVKKTRNEFIDNISSLVERDIINDKTLSSELNKEHFKESIRKFINDLLNIHMSKNANDLRLYDVDCLDTSINNIETYTKHCCFEYLPNVFNSLYKNVYLKDLLTEKQVNYISENLVEELIHILNDTDFIENTISDFYNENKNLNFGDFLGDKLFKIVGENIEKEVLHINLRLKEGFNANIDNALERSINILQIHNILKELEKELSEKTLINFIGKDTGDRLSINLTTKIKEFIRSYEGKELINNFSKDIFNILKTIDKPILDLLSNNLQQSLESFFKDKAQYGIKEIILWVEKNKENIEELIEKSIDDTVESMDDGAKKEIINSIKSRFLSDIGTKFNIVGKITEYVDNNADIDSISKDISYKFINYIKEENISTIIEKLEEKNIFTEQKFSEFIFYNINNYIDKLPEDYFCKFLSKKIKDVYEINLVNLFEAYIKQPLFNIIKDKYIYTERFAQYITSVLLENLNNVKNLSFKEILSKDQLKLGSVNIKRILINELKSNKIEIIQSASKKFDINVKNVTLNKPLDENLRKNILSEVINTSFDKISEFKDVYKEKKIKDTFKKISNIKNIDTILTEIIVKSLNNNLNHILKGNIKSTVSSNLNDLKDEELQLMVEEFMGKEMKPITVIGALLGGIIGIGTYFLDNSTVNLNYYTITLINIVVYGIVGWLTNVQALAMLFKPYTEKKFLGIKIPFTPGVLIKRKPKFAKSMSTFVDEELLNKESMKKLFNKKNQYIYDKVKGKLSNNDYKLVLDILEENSNEIINKICSYIRSLIHNNKNEISKILVSKQKNFNMSKIDFSKVEAEILKQVLEKVEESYEILVNCISNEIYGDKKVSSLMPKEYESLIKEKINYKIEQEIKKLLAYEKELSKESLNSLILSKYKNIGDKSISQLINPKHLYEYKLNISNLLINKITSETSKNKIFNYIENLIEKQISPDKKIGELFGGFFSELIKSNVNYIMDNAINSIIKGISAKKQVIAEVAITSTKENLNFFEVIGYNMLGGDEIISTIVNNFVNEKLPVFISEKKIELNETLNGFIDNKICGSNIEELNINIESKAILNTVNRFLSDEESLNVLTINITKTIDKLVNSIIHIKIEQALNTLSIEKIEDLTELFNEEISIVEKSLKNNINLNKETLINEYSKLSYDIFQDLIFSQEINRFTQGIDGKYIEQVCKKFINIACKSKSVNENCVMFTKEFVSNNIKNKKVEQLFNIEEINNSTVIIIEKLMQNEEISKISRKAVDSIIKDIIENKFNILHEDTKEFVASLFISSVKDSLKENFPNIISSIDFKHITEKEISNMKPKEIEALFNSFAEKYFNRLKLYGFGGALFGIHWSIGVATFISYTVSSIKESFKS